MYVICRRDLPPGLQVAQAVHAAFQFAVGHAAATRHWHDTSNIVVVLVVADEDVLLDLADYTAREHIPYVLVHEPDVDGHTALAALGPIFGRHVSTLPLLGAAMT